MFLLLFQCTSGSCRGPTAREREKERGRGEVYTNILSRRNYILERKKRSVKLRVARYLCTKLKFSLPGILPYRYMRWKTTEDVIIIKRRGEEGARARRVGILGSVAGSSVSGVCKVLSCAGGISNYRRNKLIRKCATEPGKREGVKGGVYIYLWVFIRN